ncbi:MAG: OsmC family protein [Rhodospirillales bacterium]
MERIHRYRPTVHWIGDRGVGTSGYRHYGREHVIAAAGKPEIAGSADPAFRGDPTRYSPEDLLVASVSACHMLWYLHLCADAGVVVVGYVDEAEGTMVEAADGGGRFSGVVLRPRVVVVGGSDTALAVSLHEKAHRLCFIANSVSFPIACEPTVTIEDPRHDGG